MIEEKKRQPGIISDVHFFVTEWEDPIDTSVTTESFITNKKKSSKAIKFLSKAKIHSIESSPKFLDKASKNASFKDTNRKLSGHASTKSSFSSIPDTLPQKPYSAPIPSTSKHLEFDKDTSNQVLRNSSSNLFSSSNIDHSSLFRDMERSGNGGNKAVDDKSLSDCDSDNDYGDEVHRGTGRSRKHSENTGNNNQGDSYNHNERSDRVEAHHASSSRRNSWSDHVGTLSSSTRKVISPTPEILARREKEKEREMKAKLLLDKKEQELIEKQVVFTKVLLSTV